ncbi:hypothetical protein WJX79_006434 [Trebouxia sp. C0005]
MAQVACIIICPNGSAYPRVAATIGSHGQRSPALLQVGAEAHQAGFLGGKQILSAPLGSSVAPNQVAALSAFAALGSPPETLVVIDGASLCEPGFSLHRFIQHSLVRGKDCFAFSSGPTEQLGQQVQVQLEGSSANPRVIGLQALQSDSANAFFCFYQQHWKLLHGQTDMSASSVLQINTGEAGASGVDTAPMHAVLHEFNHSYAAAMTAEAYARYMQGRSGVLGMPERFTDASLWRWRRKQQHPVYMTSNNEYGAKPPSQQMLPPSWHGVKGEFTKNYIKNEIRTGNFSTGLPISRVHDALTELC